jgi:hypothetical protein
VAILQHLLEIYGAHCLPSGTSRASVGTWRDEPLRVEAASGDGHGGR